MKNFLATAAFIIILGTSFMPLQVGAQSTNYQLLAPIPLQGSGGCTGNANETCKTNPKAYIEGIFTLTIAIAGILAVVMIIFGGIKYMSTDAFSGKSEAKDTIQNAIVGLLLAISSWLILHTVNPDLVKFNLSIKPQSIATPATPTGGSGGGGTGGPSGSGVPDGHILPWYPLSADQIAQNTSMRASLAANNPPITANSGPCTTTGMVSGCTNLVGLPGPAITGVRNLARDCGCSIIISGGAEGGHDSHGPDIPNMDIRKGASTKLDNYIMSGQTTSSPCGVTNAPKYRVGGGIYTNEGDHWHACY